MFKTRARVSADDAQGEPRVEGFPHSETRLRTTTILPPATQPSSYIKDVSDLLSVPPTHYGHVSSDNAFQRRARLLQSLWRQRKGLPIGHHRGRALGSRIAMPLAKDNLSNYLTRTIRKVVCREVLDPEQSRGKLFAKPRIFDDLLSSQPLCFNLFAELQQDLPLASRVFSRLSLDRIAEVQAIRFEHSPGRGLAKYTGDRSAFDVFVEYVTKTGAKGFVGIEVKYHEDLNDKPAPHHERYNEIATQMGCFDTAGLDRLQQKPLQQIWRDHLLAGSLRLDPESGYADGFFAFLYPEQNDCCERAVNRYAARLTNRNTFVRWTLETVVAAIKEEGAGKWIGAFEERYLAFGDAG